MEQKRLPLIALLAVAIALPAVSQTASRSVCEYYPPESRVRDLGVQGWLSVYDGPYADDRERALSTDFVLDYAELSASPSFGHTLDGRAEARGTAEGWTAELTGAGSLRTSIDDRLFAVGELGVDASSAPSVEVDATAGIGSGQFRDVTPMAQAIRIQNDLLDLGELLAPVGDDVLLELAQVLGEVGPSDEERTIRLAERLTATGLVSGEDLGIRALLAIEETLASSDRTRLCGRDVQARVGASARLLPDFDVAATAILLGRFAAVPDPVSQFASGAELKVRLARPDELHLNADLSYERRLPEDWNARAEYRLSIDREWTSPGAIVVSHSLSAGLTAQLLGAAGLSLAADAAYTTGDEEIALTVTLQFEADLL